MKLFTDSSDPRWVDLKSTLREVLIGINGLKAENSQEITEQENLISQKVSKREFEIDNNRSPNSSLFLKITDLERVDLPSMLSSDEFENVKHLRTIGLDGILICLFLVKHNDVVSSAQAIHKELQIPISTVYRLLTKLEELKYVKSIIALDYPNKAYYQITQFGESIVIDLYDLINLHSNSYL